MTLPINWQTLPGLTDYQHSLQAMEALVQSIIAGGQEQMLLLEHPPLYTAGTSAKMADLLQKDRFPVYQAGRGGEFTYHGPGQRVAYVMLNLKARQAEDVRAYVTNLEQWLINTLARFNIDAMRKPGRIGIWVETGKSEAKIAAIGIRLRKWVTYHGISINLAPNLSHFSGIVPCGIANYGVTSMAELGKNVTMDELDKVLKEEFHGVFVVD